MELFRKQILTMIYWIPFLCLLFGVIKCERDADCGIADTPFPPHPHFSHKQLKSFRGFSPEVKNTSLAISDMFREHEITRRCVTWQDSPQDCDLYLECRMFACFSHLEHEDLNPDTHFTVELYGYAKGRGWVSLAISNSTDTAPVKNAFQLDCLRHHDYNFSLQAAIVDDGGMKHVLSKKDQDKFVTLKTAKGDKFFKNFVYCKAYLSRQIVKNRKLLFDFDTTEYYPIIGVGEFFSGTTPGLVKLNEPCSRPPPKFPMLLHRSYEPSEEDKKLILYHGILMIIVFVVLFPCAIFPIRYLKFAQNNEHPYWGIKEYLINHLIFSIPLFPMMFAAVYLARLAHSDTFKFQSHTNSSYGHGTAGVLCYQIFSIQFYIGLFSYPFLTINSSYLLRMMHAMMNYLGFVFSAHIMSTIKLAHYTGTNRGFYLTYYFFLWVEFVIHFIMTFYHFLLRLLPFKDPNFFPHSRVYTFPQILFQQTKEIQRQPFPGWHIKLWWIHMMLCVAFASTMIYTIDVPTRYPEGSWVLTPELRFAGEFLYDWEFFWNYIY